MERVTGIGGIFFKSDNPDELYRWYEEHLGVKREDPSAAVFHWRHKDEPEKPGMTVWSIMKRETTYMSPGHATFMINYRVDDLDAVLEALKQEGVEADPKVEDNEFGKFSWVVDPEGNRIELWQPPKGM